MKCSSLYDSPLGAILLDADDEGLTGLHFCDRKITLPKEDRSPFEETFRWLDLYFSGNKPGSIPKIHLSGTDFQLQVWRILLQIPYGQTVSYAWIAKRIALLHGIEKMSAQAVGGAVGRNPIALIVPCHRVIGSNGTLTGYAGGLERKCKLLALEGIRQNSCRAPGK